MNSKASIRHPRELREQGRPRVHLQAARRSQMVRRPALHHRGFPLLLGRRRQQQGALALRPVGRASGRRPAAQGRDHRRPHHQVQLGQAQSLLHRKPGARRAALPVPPPGALPQEVPSQVHRPGGDRQVGQGRPGRQLGADLPAARRHVCQRQHHPRRRSTRGSTPRRRRPSATSSRATRSITASTRRAAAALHRQGDLHPGGDQSRAGQGGAGRGRPAAALHQHARLHFPAEERQELGRRRAPVGVGIGLADRALSQPQRQRRGMAQADARRALPPGLVGGDRRLRRYHREPGR